MAAACVEETSPEYTETKPRKPQKKRQTRAEKVSGILIGLAHEELVDLLEELAAEDRQIANMSWSQKIPLYPYRSR